MVEMTGLPGAIGHEWSTRDGHFMRLMQRFMQATMQAIILAQ